MSNPQFFETITKSFVDVKITEEGVNTAEFLEAAENLVKIFDLFGNPAFAIVKSDMNGNIMKIRNYLAANPANDTLEKMVADEKTRFSKKKERVATDALQWLLRGLNFTCLALRHNLDNAEAELAASFANSYETSLKPYHGILVRPAFALAMKACPYRKDFYPKLGEPQTEVLPKLDKWLTALDDIVKRETKVYADNTYGEIVPPA